MKGKYPFPPKDGPLDPDGRPALLPLKDCMATNYLAACPHCRAFDEAGSRTEGEHHCAKCGRSYFLTVLHGAVFLTSKRSIIHEFLWN